jgi:hypothetical protein
MLEQIAEELADAIGEASGSSTIASSFRGRALEHESDRGVARDAFAKARDRGAYITPKGGKGAPVRRRLVPPLRAAQAAQLRRARGCGSGASDRRSAFARHFGDLGHERRRVSLERDVARGSSRSPRRRRRRRGLDHEPAELPSALGDGAVVTMLGLPPAQQTPRPASHDHLLLARERLRQPDPGVRRRAVRARRRARAAARRSRAPTGTRTASWTNGR